ncbi:hypothetical protein TEA_015475 [Camellia sinensis var. sinensis]|uniref:ArsA/GET3 Anion-transporting ATPase-like domain-containing protein n=1 Tax=Camellia sinensis var. sinensis TaxID=542762 RepID=A0A4S4DNG6_CAMSN|nr:hypothetical protein TEA_015475 [Camellia sinensis var. sinensis]
MLESTQFYDHHAIYVVTSPLRLKLLFMGRKLQGIRCLPLPGLKQKIASATSAIKSVFGQEDTRPDPAEKLERLRDRMIKVRELFHDKDSTEFVIVTIPTVMAISESSRLRASLKKENVPVKRLIVNQVLPPSASDCKFCAMKRKDQMRALDMIQNDPELSGLSLIQAPLVDVEIRGVPALQFLGDIVWK